MADRDAKVCLTFDFDAISVWPGALGMTSPSAVSRVEFSGRVAVPRVLDVLKREGVSATFFVPGITVEAWPALCHRVLDGHRGDRAERVATFGPEIELLEIPFSWTLVDFPQMEFVPTPDGVFVEGLSDPEKCERMWLADLDYMVEDIPGGVYTICFHPEIIGRGARVRVLERIIARAKEHRVQFMTSHAAAEDWISRHPFDRAVAAARSALRFRRAGRAAVSAQRRRVRARPW